MSCLWVTKQPLEKTMQLNSSTISVSDIIKNLTVVVVLSTRLRLIAV